MSSLSSSTRPVIQPCSDSSCIRLSVRRKVDFPQPDGPISAWTRLAVNPIETPFTAVNLPYMAVSVSVSIRTRAGAGRAGARTSGGAVRSPGRLGSVTATSPIEVEPPADGEPRADAQHQHDQDEDERGGPGVAVPLLVGAGRVREHRERQGGHRPVQAIAQVLAAQRGEEEDRKSTRLNSSHMSISYAVFCLKKKKKT